MDCRRAWTRRRLQKTLRETFGSDTGTRKMQEDADGDYAGGEPIDGSVRTHVPGAPIDRYRASARAAPGIRGVPGGTGCRGDFAPGGGGLSGRGVRGGRGG